MANTEKPKFDQIAYKNRYSKEHYKKYLLILHKQKDSKVIEQLDKQKSKSEYLRKLIKKDIGEDD